MTLNFGQKEPINEIDPRFKMDTSKQNVELIHCMFPDLAIRCLSDMPGISSDVDVYEITDKRVWKTLSFTMTKGYRIHPDDNIIQYLAANMPEDKE